MKVGNFNVSKKLLVLSILQKSQFLNQLPIHTIKMGSVETRHEIKGSPNYINNLQIFDSIEYRGRNNDESLELVGVKEPWI